MKERNVSVDVPGLFGAMLTILFIGLKLTGHIAWSWWWVLSPLWVPAAIAATIVFVAWLFGAFK